MLRSQESYVPMCLPGISEQGYIQFYSNFSEENIGVIFVTENIDPMCFVKFQEQYNKLYKRLNDENYIEKIMNSFRMNNNIFGDYTLMKQDKENRENIEKEEEKNGDKEKEKEKEKEGKVELVKEKEEINTDILISQLINKMFKKGKSRTSSKKIEKLNKSINSLDGSSQCINKINLDSNINNDLFAGKNEKVINKVFEGIKYGVALNKKLGQYILFNFDMDFRVYDKFKKKLIHEYNILYDKVYTQLNENEDFSYIQKSKYFVNVVEANENFLIICSYNFFSYYDEVGKKAKDLIKYLKKNESKHFIIFK
jgi:hypothetical protein